MRFSPWVAAQGARKSLRFMSAKTATHPTTAWTSSAARREMRLARQRATHRAAEQLAYSHVVGQRRATVVTLARCATVLGPSAS